MMHRSGDTPARRRFLGRIVLAVQSLLVGTVGGVVSWTAVAPALSRTRQTWLPAATLSTLRKGEPTAVTLRLMRQDGYAQVVDRRMVFLLRDDETTVTAFDSTCTHLGCRVSWDPESELLLCPCHGGAYDRRGAVKTGPPSESLAAVAVRVDGDEVLVQL